jgi:hypothetical protein
MIDHSLFKKQTHLKTVQYLLKSRNKSKKTTLDAICFSLPHFSDGSIPSWAPDWSLRPNFRSAMEMTMISLSFLYNANRGSPPDPKIVISGEVLIVQGLEIATIDYFGPVPVSMPAVEPVGSSIQETMSKTGLIVAAFQAASKLAMFDSKGMPHSHKSLDIQREELARTYCAITGCIHPTTVHVLH